MSADDVAKQIGKAVIEYRDAKIECSRIEAKVDEVFEAYRYAGRQTDPSEHVKFDPILKDGKVIIGPEAIKFDTSELRNASELASLLSERDASRERLKISRKALDRLGMSDIS